MEITVISDKNQWNLAKDGPFQQSWEWGEVLIGEGKKVIRLAVEDGGSVVAWAQVVSMPLPFGWRYALCTKGPVFAERGSHNADPEVYRTLIEHLKSKKCLFFRFEPTETFRDARYTICKTIGLSPSTTTTLDLKRPWETLLSAMDKKTRYSIRQAESKGVVVKQEKNWEIFWSLMQKTAKRNDLRMHVEKHYRTILENNSSIQLVAYQGDTPIATAVFWGFGDTFTYLFAASDYEYHEMSAPYLIQKEAIQLAQTLGYTLYDFFGIAPPILSKDGSGGGLPSALTSAPQSMATPPNLSLVRGGNEYSYDKNHSYAGITQFKIRFGGAVVENPGTFDLVLNPISYRLYGLLRKLRRMV